MENLKVLYVEDDLDLQETFCELLSDIFKEVSVASDGLEALDIYEKESIDLIITDINMPKMDGLTFASNIKKKDKNIPILVMSAYNDNQYLIKSIEIGVDGYILKPLQLDQLLLQVEKIVHDMKSKKELKLYRRLLQEYKDAIDISSIISKTDSRGIITFVNDAFCKISGYRRDELIGKNHNLVRDPDMKKEVFENLWRTIQSNRTWSGIIKNRRKDGTIYYVQSYINPIQNDHGEIVEYIGIRNDITELELYKQDIEQQLHLATKDIIDTQKEVVFTMGAIGETRSKETGLHVKRVAEYSYLLATLYGLSEDEAQLLRQASPMHDIGKVGIADSILNKPEKLTNDEFEIMKTHATLGYEMLKHSNKDILQSASIVAYEHHEKWDGNGYPRGLAGEDIHIFGRITAVADVFDALGHDRCYKKAWELDKIFELFKTESGKHFDPKLIDIFFKNIDKFLSVRDSLKD